jgi:hypothetical protein
MLEMWAASPELESGPRLHANAAETVVMTQGSSALCEWCELPFRARRGGSAQRFCRAKCRNMFWSALRRSGDRALAEGILSMTDLRRGVATACTLRQRTERLPPLSDTGRHDLALPDGLLRFSVELEPAIVDQLGGLGLIKPTEVRDLAAILTALRRIGITPTISCSA